MDNKKVITLGIASGAGIATFSLIMLVLSSKGFIGWVRWEYLGLLALLGVAIIFVATVILGFLSIYSDKLQKPTLIYSSIVLVVMMSMLITLGACGNVKNLKSNLSFYYSTDSYITETTDISIAVASDSHYGSKSSNPEARHNIMTSIKKGNHDLMIHGGDVVDLGMNKNWLREANQDMEEYLGDQRISFVMGNHDSLTNGEKNFRNLFMKGETQLSHVLEVAPKVHYVVFNMIWDYSEVKKSEMKWLEETLASFPKEDCVIVQSHSYYYATGGKIGMAKWYDIDNVIDNITPLFEKYNVDLVVSGHIHTMEMLEQNNVNYALVGPFGSSLYDDTSHPSKANSLFQNGTDYGYTTLDINSEQIKVNFRNESGQSLFAKEIQYN